MEWYDALMGKMLGGWGGCFLLWVGALTCGSVGALVCGWVLWSVGGCTGLSVGVLNR